jgi:hypothetical protein
MLNQSRPGLPMPTTPQPEPYGQSSPDTTAYTQSYYDAYYQPYYYDYRRMLGFRP